MAFERYVQPVPDAAIPLHRPSGDTGVDYHDLCGNLFGHPRDNLGRVPPNHPQVTAGMPERALQSRHG